MSETKKSDAAVSNVQIYSITLWPEMNFISVVFLIDRKQNEVADFCHGQ